jgi:hypothetical protein
LNVSRSFFCIVFTSASLLIGGCTDEPNPVGFDVLPRTDLSPAQIDTVYANYHHTVPSLLATSTLDRMMLGITTTSDQWKYESWSCIKFFSWPDSLLGVTIDTARIFLKTVSTFGSSSVALTFAVHRASLNWAGDSLSYDSLKLPSSYYDNSPLLTQSREDTGWVMINLQDTALVRTWFLSNTDTVHRNDGLILRPTNSSVIKGLSTFYSVDAAALPQLVVSYTKDGQHGTYRHTYGTAKFVSATTPPSSVHINNDSLMFYAQNGVAFHGHVGFDSLRLPQQTLLYGAILELTLNISASRIIEHDSLLAYQTKADESIDYYNYYDLGVPSTSSSGKRIYKFNIRNLVVQWIKGTAKSELTFGGYAEGLSYDLFALYGSGSGTSPLLRPRIIITYYTKQ